MAVVVGRSTGSLGITQYMLEIPRGKANALINQDEARISGEVYDLYCFLREHPTIGQVAHRMKDILRASVSGTPFGYIFGGLVSAAAADTIDERLTSGTLDPCKGLQRDHIYTWKETSEFLLTHRKMNQAEFWAELKRRNEIALLLRTEHARVSALQRKGHGPLAYDLAGIALVRVDPRAIKLSGNKAGLVRAYWTAPKARQLAKLNLRTIGEPA